MTTLSTHVLDADRGRPAEGIAVAVERAGEVLARGVTDGDGRHRFEVTLTPGVHRIVFTVDGPFYPEVVVAFRVTAEPHLHVPVLLSPFAYTTYRGS
ncbi:hydroxyisourate hydrolase [Actinosynnema sp. NPDC020468]|uniref:hydroxyisourate hydrolase n=1 Tax=Actinosynnema sp. NPDC020468 TaxID=3154488 RepID=UPI0033DD74A9